MPSHAGRDGAAAVTGLAGPALAQDQPLVAVTAIVEHPALDAARDGVKEALAEEGFVDGKKMTFTYGVPRATRPPPCRSRASSSARRRR